jgi:Zn-dependent protease
MAHRARSGQLDLLDSFGGMAGYWTIGNFRGAPIRLHWSVLLFGFWFARGSIAAWIAILLLILAHELGHAVFVRRFGHRVISIDVTGFGGACAWTGSATPRESALIAWGGVIVQAILYALAQLYVLVEGDPRSAVDWAIYGVFTRTNLWIMAINLLPFEPLDGARAWTIFRHLESTPHKPPVERPPAAAPVDRSEDDDPERRAARERERRFEKLVDDIQSATADPRPDRKD